MLYSLSAVTASPPYAACPKMHETVEVYQVCPFLWDDDRVSPSICLVNPITTSLYLVMSVHIRSVLYRHPGILGQASLKILYGGGT